MENDSSLTARRCDFCRSIEGELRKVGNYITVLEDVALEGERKLACQGCKRKNKRLGSFVTACEKRKV